MFQKRFSKTVSLVLTVAFIFVTGLSGCGTKETSPSATTAVDTKSDTTVSTDSPANLPFVKLKYYVGSANPDITRQDAVEENFNKILKEKLNCELHFNVVSGGQAEFGQKVSLSAASGEEYDLIMAGTGWINLSQEVAKKTIIPLDDLLKKYAPAVIEKVSAKNFTAATIGGGIYAIPHPFVYGQTNSFAFKQDLAEKYGLDTSTIKSYKDMGPYLAKIKAGEPSITPLIPNATLVYDRDRYDALLGNIIGYFPEDNKVKTIFEDTKTVENWKALNDYFKKGYIAKDAATKTDFNAEVKSGRYAVYVGAGIYSADGSRSTNLYGIPSAEALHGSKLVGTAAVMSCAAAISATSKNPERAMMLENLLYSDRQVLEALCAGVEGVDYKVLSGAGTQVQEIETIQPMKWKIWECWIGSLWDSWGDTKGNSTAFLNELKAATDTAPVSPLLGFTFDSEPVKTEIGKITAITTNVDKLLGTGSVPDVDAYIADIKEKLDQAGLTKVIAEMEKQIAEWKVKNGK